MKAFLQAPFGQVAPFLADYGYSPVPIKPLFKAPMLDDWQAGHPVDHYLPYREPVTGRVTDCSRHGTGILTRTCPAVDLDIRDRELVRVLIELAGEMLGPSPFRIGAPPKALLPFCTEKPFDKVSGKWWALPGEDWRSEGYSPHRIEVLCNGQQFCAYARHPRGTFYRWTRGEPMDTYRVDLPELDQASAKAFLKAAEQVISEVGAVPLRRIGKLWFPDIARPEAERARRRAAGPLDDSWPRLDPETLARKIDPEHAAPLSGSKGWVCTCPAHHGIGHRSLSITRRSGGGAVVHCFADCGFVEIARAISDLLKDEVAWA